MTTTKVIAANELLAQHSSLLLHVKATQQNYRKQLLALHTPPSELINIPLLSSPPQSHASSRSLSPSERQPKHVQRPDLSPAKRARIDRYHNYIPEEETVRNDYSQRYVDGGEWPQNWVLGAEPDRRFEEYPKQQRLLNLKKESMNLHSLPPYYRCFPDLSVLHPSKFDVILIDPPFSSSFSWEHLLDLPIPTLAADPSFVLMWVGSGAGEGLERGREIMAKWGYRRCEDVVWVKTNKTTNNGPGTDPPTTSLLTRTKQHCLIGIRGTVRRSTDSWFVHCNVDTDVIIWEGDPSDPTRKPPEMYTLIENFCLGSRRLELFGRPSSLRRGWVTVLAAGQDEHLQTTKDGSVFVQGEEGGITTLWQQDSWEASIKEMANGGKAVVPMTQEIDSLRPKSPFRVTQSAAAFGGNAGSSKFGLGARLPFNNIVLRVAETNDSPGSMIMQPMGMGVQQLGMDDMMNWNSMMNTMGMVNMNVGGMGNGQMGIGGMVNGGMNLPMMGAMSQMAPMPHTGPMPQMGPIQQIASISQMGAGAGFPPQNPNFNPGMPMFAGGGMPWGDQSQFGIDGSWNGGDQVMNMGIQGMMGAMNVGGMNLNTNGMGMGGNWGGSGVFDGMGFK